MHIYALNQIDLASSALGTTIVEVTDEFFAPATMMINPQPAISCPDKFVGKSLSIFLLLFIS